MPGEVNVLGTAYARHLAGDWQSRRKHARIRLERKGGDLGVIDALSRGFRKVNQHWWLLLVPVLLDVFLWIGPQASVEKMVDRAFRSLQVDLAQVETVDSTGEDLWVAIRDLSRQVIPGYNNFSALRIGSLGVPSLTAWGGARLGMPSSYEIIWLTFALMVDMPELLVSVRDASFVASPIWQVPNELVWILVSLGLTVLGIVIGSFYITALSRTLDEGTSLRLREVWPRALKFASRYGAFWLLKIGLLVAMGLPVLMLISLLAVFSPGLASLFGTIVLGVITWASFYGIFFVAALAMGEPSIWRAIWSSFNVVLRNFWPTLGLFVLINLIGGGLSILWQQLSHGSWLTLIGIVGNAYVGTGLVAASLLFYRDRYVHWRELVAELIRRSKRVA